jgi:glucuronokinase
VSDVCWPRIEQKAKEAMEAHDWNTVADLMDANFALRRRTYGDAAIGQKMLKLIEIAQKHGAAAKFPGSGGAVVGMCRDPAQLGPLREEYVSEGTVFCLLEPATPRTSHFE